jgi:signal transduction histidine kinase
VSHGRGAGVGGSGIRFRVYLLMATGIFFPLALMAAAGLYWLRALDDRILAGRLAAATLAAAHFDGQLTDDLEILQRLSAAVGSGFGDAELADERRAAREAHHQFRHRESVYILDAEGNVIAEEPPGPVSAAPHQDLPLVEEVLRTGRPRMSGVVLGERGPVVHELVPIRAVWENKIVGVAGGAFDPARRGLDKMLEYLRRGQTGFAELIDARGAIVASTVPGRVGRETECKLQLSALVRDKRALSVRCGDCHAERRMTAHRPAELLAFAPLASAPWGVVVRQSAAEALPTEGSIPWYGVMAVLFVQLGLASAFAWGAARSVTRPVEVLTDEAERISHGDLAWPIPDLGGDEVGRLGKALDRMRVNLRQLIQQIADANTGLEHRVDERTRELNDANARLREREETRGELLRKVITAQEDERKRIARELHDETTQSLAVLAMGIEGAQDAIRGGRTPRLDEVKAVAVRTLEDVHRLILDLRPSVLDDLGLLSAIRWYAERQLETRGIAVRFEFGEYDRRLAPEMETALFRICQEAMSNVARHAQATAVLIQVALEGGEFRIDVEDDGKGFDLEAATRREGRRPWGLMGIRERAEILGGTARVESAPGKGTHVEVRIPVPPDAPTAAPGSADATAAARVE